MSSFKFLIGTLFGAGLLPKAPGTWGSLACLPLIYIISITYSTWGVALFLIITSLLSLWATSESVRRFGDDPSQFVMDEVAGQSVVFLFISFRGDLFADLGLLLGGFLLFRLFDITKPFGIKRVEKFPGKYGILVDDLVAGIYALICLEAVSAVAASLM